MATTTAPIPLSAEFQKKKEDPTLMTKEEFFANVDEASEQARQGKVHRMLPGESLDDFLNRVRP